METKIYLPEYTIRQLEELDNAFVWAKPIPYLKHPSSEFPLEYVFDPEDHADNECIDPTDKDYFYPYRIEPDLVLERLVLLDVEKLRKDELKKEYKEKLASVGKHSDAIYRCFLGYNSYAECWARYENEKIEVISNHVFDFVEFENVKPFRQKQEYILEKVLREGAGLVLNTKEVKLCDGGSYNENFSSKYSKFAFEDTDIPSIDGKTYKLFLDLDDGARGWAILTVKPKKRVRVLYENHADNLRYCLIDNDMEYVKKLGFNINFKQLLRDNHDFYKEAYIPTKEDFEEDFHIDEELNKTKA